MDLLDPLLDPLRSGIDRRALLEVALLGAVCGALGFWVVVERLSYAAESLSHGLLPGLVLAALAGAPLLLGAAGGVAVAAALIAVAARDPRIGPEAATGVVVTGPGGARARCSRSRPTRPSASRSCSSATRSGVSDSRPGGRRGCSPCAGGLALFALHRPLAATGVRRRGRRGARPPAAADAPRAARARGGRGGGGGAGPRRAALAGAARGARAGGAAAGRARPGRALAGRRGRGSGRRAWWASTCRYHAGTAAGASVALALCLAAALGSLRYAARPGCRARSGA